MVGRDVGRRTALLSVLGLAGAATSCQPYRACDPVDEASVSELPALLSLTGLYATAGDETLGSEVRAFRPRFELWSDGASKRRWIWLPPGARVDTSEMDAWQFPVGTKVWKEFVRDGVRVETRLLQRLPDAWIGVAYVWNEAGTEAVAAPYGAIDALGTPHDVPASNECDACHAGRKSHVLGFSALQLTRSAEPGALDLDELARLELVSHAPPAPPTVPGNETEQTALGYLHANCSHCHNASRPARDGARCFDPENELDFTLHAETEESVGATSTYRTAVDEHVKPGNAGDSQLLELVQQRSRFRQMPPLATETVDAAAVALLRRWIEEM